MVDQQPQEPGKGKAIAFTVLVHVLLIADALELGYGATVQAYLRCIEAGLAAPEANPQRPHGSADGIRNHS